MPYMMKGRNESVFYFDENVQLPKADAWLRAFNVAHPGMSADIFHLALWAVRDCMVRWPTMNRFVMGGRLYQRREITFTYAVKRRLKDTGSGGADMATVKRTFPPDEAFEDLVAAIADQTRQERFGGPTHTDRELRVILKLPGVLRRVFVGAMRVLDAYGVLPRKWIDGDPMYTSAFLAHMASFGMPAGYHHLYEYGTAGVFVVLGRPTTDPGSPTSGPDRRRTMRVTFSFDERTEDGMIAWRSIQHFKRILEDPGAVAGLEGLTESPEGFTAGVDLGPDSGSAAADAPEPPGARIASNGHQGGAPDASGGVRHDAAAGAAGTAGGSE